MARNTIVTNVSRQALNLYPYQGLLEPGESVIVASTPTEFLAQFGGVDGSVAKLLSIDSTGADATVTEATSGGGTPDTPQNVDEAGPKDASSTTVLVNFAGAATVNLPAGLTTGEAYTVKDSSGAAATNNISITATTGNIDGSATATISSDYGSLTLVSDGANWFIT